MSSSETWLPIILGFLAFFIIAFFLRKITEYVRRIPSRLASHVDLRDGFYSFLRAVDGDTIIVAPPDQLRGLVKDIRVRLYGIETPEHWEKFGRDYKYHLENLCSIDAGGTLYIVWDRKKPGVQYEGFPETSFDREVGHLFIRTKDSQFVYINGLMLTLRLTTVFRKGVSLLRGKRVKSLLEFEYNFDSCSFSELPTLPVCSDTYRYISSLNPPLPLLVFPKVTPLDPRSLRLDGEPIESLQSLFADRSHLGHWEQFAFQGFRRAVREVRMSPYDAPLWSLQVWSTRTHGGRALEALELDSSNEIGSTSGPLTESEKLDLEKLEGLLEHGHKLTPNERLRLNGYARRKSTHNGDPGKY